MPLILIVRLILIVIDLLGIRWMHTVRRGPRPTDPITRKWGESSRLRPAPDSETRRGQNYVAASRMSRAHDLNMFGS